MASCELNPEHCLSHTSIPPGARLACPVSFLDVDNPKTMCCDYKVPRPISQSQTQNSDLLLFSHTGSMTHWENLRGEVEKD